MLNTKENFNQLDATLAVNELDDEIAAACSGGAAVTLYENGRFNRDKDGRVLPVDGNIANLGSFNDITSSFKITSGRWNFYADENYNNFLFSRGPGSYPVVPRGTNDRVSSIKRA
jgi:hypothetical protein